MEKEISRTLKISRFISGSITVIGIFLVIYMVKVEDELGALPLLFIVGGSIWFLITRNKLRKQLTKDQ